jgi:hypothetical protein
MAFQTMQRESMNKHKLSRTGKITSITAMSIAGLSAASMHALHGFAVLAATFAVTLLLVSMETLAQV